MSGLASSLAPRLHGIVAHQDKDCGFIISYDGCAIANGQD